MIREKNLALRKHVQENDSLGFRNQQVTSHDQARSMQGIERVGLKLTYGVFLVMCVVSKRCLLQDEVT